MEQLVLKATKRTETGNLPAVMYNHQGQATMISVNEAEFTKVWKQATKTTIICLDVDGTKYQAFIKDTEYNIISNRNLHVDFHVIEDTQKIRTTIKVQTSGTPVGVREGGVLMTTGIAVKIECLPKDLPARIVADIDPIKIGETFYIKDLKLNDGIKVLTNPDAVVVSVRSGK